MYANTNDASRPSSTSSSATPDHMGPRKLRIDAARFQGVVSALKEELGLLVEVQAAFVKVTHGKRPDSPAVYVPRRDTVARVDLAGFKAPEGVAALDLDEDERFGAVEQQLDLSAAEGEDVATAETRVLGGFAKLLYHMVTQRKDMSRRQRGTLGRKGTGHREGWEAPELGALVRTVARGRDAQLEAPSAGGDGGSLSKAEARAEEARASSATTDDLTEVAKTLAPAVLAGTGKKNGGKARAARRGR